MTNEPKAIEPQWYIKSHQTALNIVPLPLVSVPTSKYQRHAEAAIINWVHPTKNELIQKRPKTWNARAPLVVFSHLISVIKGNPNRGYGVPLAKIHIAATSQTTPYDKQTIRQTDGINIIYILAPIYYEVVLKTATPSLIAL